MLAPAAAFIYAGSLLPLLQAKEQSEASGSTDIRQLRLHTHPIAPDSEEQALLHMEGDITHAKSFGPHLMACPVNDGFRLYYIHSEGIEKIGDFPAN